MWWWMREDGEWYRIGQRPNDETSSCRRPEVDALANRRDGIRIGTDRVCTGERLRPPAFDNPGGTARPATARGSAPAIAITSKRTDDRLAVGGEALERASASASGSRAWWRQRSGCVCARKGRFADRRKQRFSSARG